MLPTVLVDGRALGEQDEPDFPERVHRARAALAGLVEAGVFRPEAERRIVFDHCFDSVDAWLGYLAAEWTAAQPHPQVVRRARRAWRRSGGEVIVRQQVRAARLRALW